MKVRVFVSLYVSVSSPPSSSIQQSSTMDLMIRNILLKHAGKYGCRVQTSADTVLSEAELLVRGELVIRSPCAKG